MLPKGFAATLLQYHLSRFSVSVLLISFVANSERIPRIIVPLLLRCLGWQSVPIKVCRAEMLLRFTRFWLQLRARTICLRAIAPLQTPLQQTFAKAILWEFFSSFSKDNASPRSLGGHDFFNELYAFQSILYKKYSLHYLLLQVISLQGIQHLMNTICNDCVALRWKKSPTASVSRQFRSWNKCYMNERQSRDSLAARRTGSE